MVRLFWICFRRTAYAGKKNEKKTNLICHRCRFAIFCARTAATALMYLVMQIYRPTQLETKTSRWKKPWCLLKFSVFFCAFVHLCVLCFFCVCSTIANAIFCGSGLSCQPLTRILISIFVGFNVNSWHKLKLAARRGGVLIILRAFGQNKVNVPRSWKGKTADGDGDDADADAVAARKWTQR